MIRVEVGELATVPAAAVVRPVASDFGPVTPAMRRFADAAGPAVVEQCARLGELPLGSAVITAAGDAAADYIVHVAIRSPAENPTPDAVRRGLLNALRRVSDWEIEAVALAPLGTGAGNLDAEESASIMVPVLLSHLETSPGPFHATIVVEDSYQKAVFESALAGRHEPVVGERAETRS